MAAPLTLQEAAALTTATADLVMTGRYCTLCAWVLLIYDHAVHLDKEIELFWYKPWSVAKALYFFNRYNALVFVGIHAMIFLSPNVSDGLCLGWFKFEGYTGTVGIASVELILGFRVVALWNRNKWIVWIVGLSVAAEIATMLAILSSAYVHMQAVSQLDKTIPYKACIPLHVPPYFFAFWLPPLGYEFLVFVLAALKGFHTLKYSFSWGKGDFTLKSTGSRLLEVMIRDSLWYFLLIFLCDMICSLIWLKGPDSLLQAVVGFGLVIPSVAGSHLLLNLRDAYYNPPGSVTTANSTGWTTTAGIGTKNAHSGYRKKLEIKRTPTFGRSKDILASGGRHRVGQLDTQWALDPDMDGVTVTAGAEAPSRSKGELGTNNVDAQHDGDCDRDDENEEDETLPTGSQRGARGTVASTIMTTATISTIDDPPPNVHSFPPSTAAAMEAHYAAERRPSDPNADFVGGPDAYVYSTRQLHMGVPARPGDLEAGKRSGAASSPQQQQPRSPTGEGESYELQHVPSNGNAV